MGKATYTVGIFAAETISVLGVQFCEENLQVTLFHSMLIHKPKYWHVKFSVYRPECPTVFTQLQ